MPKLMLSQLERHLFAAADILRGKMDAYIEIVEEHHPEIIAGNPYLQGQSDTPDHTPDGSFVPNRNTDSSPAHYRAFPNPGFHYPT